MPKTSFNYPWTLAAWIQYKPINMLYETPRKESEIKRDNDQRKNYNGHEIQI